MLSAEEFRAIVSGRRRGHFARCLRGCFFVVAKIYALVVRLRNRGYDKHPQWVHRVPIPVVCVGNLTLGGTGKTPMVRYLATCLHQRNCRVAIVSRGYRSAGEASNDEAKELAESLPSVPHIQHADRVLAAQQAREQYQADIILLDDGFQHRRLARDLDVVLLDALEPFGFDHVFPRGTLREPLEGLRRAHVVGLSRADLVSPAQRQSIRDRVGEISPQSHWIELAHRPVRLQGTRESRAIGDLTGKRVLAFCGIGNPQGFRATLDASNATVVEFTVYPDHHAFSAADFDRLRHRFSNTHADLVVCTHKDMVKLEPSWTAEIPLYAVIVELQVLCGAEQLHALLERLISPRPS